MNIQQLEYLVAVDNHRHFAKAAKASFVTQPTLSMMIQKLEEELEIKIFDRSAHPVQPTETGVQIIEQARISLWHFRQIKEIVENERNIVKGSFQLGIIPTIAPYLVPELLNKQNENHNEIELIIGENTTNNLVENLLNCSIDGALMATPLNHPKLTEYPVYYEKFYAYVSPKDKIYKEKEIDINKLEIDNIWLLESVHCLRGQIERLCQMKQKKGKKQLSVRYEAGSIDTLINVVDHNSGITIIPEMSAMGLSEEKQDNLRPFKGISSYREVSLVVSKEYVRKAMLNIILDTIKSSIPLSMQDMKLKEFAVNL